MLSIKWTRIGTKLFDMSKPYNEDSVPFNLYACLVCAIEHVEGREPELTKAWLVNAKSAVREHERRVGNPEDNLIYPETK